MKVADRILSFRTVKLLQHHATDNLTIGLAPPHAAPSVVANYNLIATDEISIRERLLIVAVESQVQGPKQNIVATAPQPGRVLARDLGGYVKNRAAVKSAKAPKLTSSAGEIPHVTEYRREVKPAAVDFHQVRASSGDPFPSTTSFVILHLLPHRQPTIPSQVSYFYARGAGIALVTPRNFKCPWESVITFFFLEARMLFCSLDLV
ncbi:hypothetical protein EVAR_79126_1 [Eumeta japonica]|uniref:Uncharacterized protein n=1 Tax=Eumeta variegata TaxID=151549 RepID=A0A4C1UU75_EUMVA|nr:hypothetical protein EVAR_79126_1 [Eumeta japonica]